MVPLVHFPSSELLTLGTNNAKSLLNFAPSFARVFAKISRFGWADYIIFGKWRWPVLQASFQDHVLPTPFSLQVADWRLVPPALSQSRFPILTLLRLLYFIAHRGRALLTWCRALCEVVPSDTF